jgi:hypothetical protein
MKGFDEEHGTKKKHKFLGNIKEEQKTLPQAIIYFFEYRDGSLL